MEWCKLFAENTPPTMEDIEKYIGTELWNNLTSHLENNYGIRPKFSYSRCSMQPGWNVKYQKSGKSLCTLYPMEGFYIALVVIGNKESVETELMLPTLSNYTQNLYHITPFSLGGRWLMLHVTEQRILDDVINLIYLRKRSKNLSQL